VEPDFVLRKNIERFEQLLASGRLDPTQTAVVTALLQAEVEALDRLTESAPPDLDPPAAPQ